MSASRSSDSRTSRHACGTSSLARLERALGGWLIEKQLEHAVHQRAAYSCRAGLLGQPIDDAKAVEQRTRHEVASARGRKGPTQRCQIGGLSRTGPGSGTSA